MTNKKRMIAVAPIAVLPETPFLFLAVIGKGDTLELDGTREGVMLRMTRRELIALRKQIDEALEEQVRGDY